MYYLAADTWWRFIGWLVLGMSVYLAYGYTRSGIGVKLGRPRRTPIMLKIAALGFLLIAIGLFTVPHDVGVQGVVTAAFTAGAEQHGRALFGVLLFFTGLLMAIVGSVMGVTTESPGEEGGE
jgi:hypothetical protein